MTLESLKERKLVKGYDVQIKILANGELTKKVVIEGSRYCERDRKDQGRGGEIR